MHCPKCVKTSLKQYKVQKTDVVVDACARCKGVWFDEDELNEVLPVASKDLQLPSDAKPTRMTCPKCRIPLEAFNYPQTYVKIDMCRECKGLWLYRSELKEIRVVRRHLKKKGTIETHAPVVGFKGDLLSWINGAIDSLSKFE